MITRWTEHLRDSQDKEAFVKDIKASYHVLNRLAEIVREDESSLDRSETNLKSYDTPNWEYKQAHKNGIREYMKAMKYILDLDQQTQKGT